MTRPVEPPPPPDSELPEEEPVDIFDLDDELSWFV